MNTVAAFAPPPEHHRCRWPGRTRPNRPRRADTATRRTRPRPAHRTTDATWICSRPEPAQEPAQEGADT